VVALVERGGKVRAKAIKKLTSTNLHEATWTRARR